MNRILRFMKLMVICVPIYYLLVYLDKKLDFKNKILKFFKSKALFIGIWILFSSIIDVKISNFFNINNDILFVTNMSFLIFVAVDQSR